MSEEPRPAAQPDAYAQAGVDIAAGQQATHLMAAAVRSTYGPEVLAGIGAFGGLYDARKLQQLNHPVLVASTDGVGTKTSVAARLGRWDTIGQDLVNHCVNDILVQGARPLFFLDYVATAQLDPQQIATIVAGVATACRAVDCAILGGETAEMPVVYQPGELDLVGTIVGLVERSQVIDGASIQPGDQLLGLPSTGLHTNGYTLARHALADLDWTTPRADLEGSTIGDALLAIHRCYLTAVEQLQTAGVTLRGLAHITGGGLPDNLPRVLPTGLGVVIKRGSWPELPIFGLIQQQGNVPDSDMFHAFNMGVGLVVVVPADQVTLAQRVLADACYHIGEVVAQPAGVEIR